MGLSAADLAEVLNRGKGRGAIGQVVVPAMPPGGTVRRRDRVAEGADQLARAVFECVRTLGKGRHALVGRETGEDHDRGEDGESAPEQRPRLHRREGAFRAGRGDHLRRRRLAGGQRRRQRIAARQRRRDLRGRRRTGRRLLLEAAQDHALDDGVESRRDRRRGRRRILAVLALELLERCAVERLAAGVELVEHQAQRVDVAAHRRALARELLRRHVGRRARHLALDDFARRDRQPEVGDARAAAAVDHDVGGLQVPVQHALVVRRGQARAELARDVERLVRGKPADALRAARPDPPRPRTPSRGTAVRRSRRRRRRGRRWDARPAGRCAPRRRSAPAARRRRRGARGRNFSATGWPSFRSSAR